MNSKPKNEFTRKRQLEWTNAICTLHDLLCTCPHPLQHTVDHLYNFEPDLKPPTPCLTTIKDGDEKDVIDGLGEGELEALFAEDTEEDSG